MATGWPRTTPARSSIRGPSRRSRCRRRCRATRHPPRSPTCRFRTRFAVARQSTLAAARRHAKRGTKVRYTLSEASTVTLQVQRLLPGQRSGKRCVKPKRRHGKCRGRPCKRWVGAQQLVRRQGSGAQSVTYTGRVAGKALRPGRYRFAITATDAAGNRSGTLYLAFRIVRR